MLAATASSVAVAGCTGDGDETETPGDGAGAPDGDAGSDGGDGTDDAAAEPSAETTTGPTADGTQTEGDETQTGGAEALVQVTSHDLGAILVGPDGMTLYNFDSDTQGAGESTCYDGCAEAWPPLTVEDESAVTAGSEVTAELTTFERDDGSLQVAANGWPLYYFASDEEPGDANGQGANDVWWVLRPDGTPVRPDATATVGGTATDADDETGGETDEATTDGAETDTDEETTDGGTATDDDGYDYPALERR